MENIRLSLRKAILPEIVTKMISSMLMMTMKVGEPESEEEMARRLEQLRTLIMDRFSSTQKKVKVIFGLIV